MQRAFVGRGGIQGESLRRTEHRAGEELKLLFNLLSQIQERKREPVIRSGRGEIAAIRFTGHSKLLLSIGHGEPRPPNFRHFGSVERLTEVLDVNAAMGEWANLTIVTYSPTAAVFIICSCRPSGIAQNPEVLACRFR